MDEATQLIIAGLAERCALASQGFSRLNEQGAPHGLQYGPSALLPVAPMLDALVEQLVERGLIDYSQFVVDSLTKQAEAMEEQLAAGATHLREATGLIVPLGFSGRPQG